MSETASIYQQLEQLVDTARTETTARVRNFLSANGLRYVIALIGDSVTEGPIAERNTSLLVDFFKHLKHSDQYAIQTGGTQGGIPEIGSRLARNYGLSTIGIYPAAARQYALEQPADLVVETPDLLYGRTSFGSETPTFVNVLDGAIVFGGGYGTRAEISTILRTNKSRQDALRRQPDNASLPRPVYLCPVAGTGKSADELVEMNLYEDIGDCLPNPRNHITSGLAAAVFINEKLPPI